MPSRRRSGRSDEPFQHRELLAHLGEARAALCRGHACMIINGPLYRAAGEVMDAIDGVAAILTGDRTHFHSRGWSSGPGMGSIRHGPPDPVD